MLRIGLRGWRWRAAMTLVLAQAAGAAPLGAARAADAPLSLERVALSTGGVGFFEFRATVSGDAALRLDAPLSQIDDILKSIAVYDFAGEVASISLPGKEPLDDVFRDAPFSRDALASTATLLQSLRGAEVVVEGPRRLEGRIVGVVAQEEPLGEGASVSRHRMTLLTAEGVRQVILEEAGAIAFADPDLQAKLDRILEGLAGLLERERRAITVDLVGEGERDVRIGYLIETPLWKSSYRLTAPAAADADEALLQGWAVLENRSGVDWDGVALSVASGNPVTFRQSLYESFYVDRPEAPIEVFGRVAPKTDRGARFEPDVAAQADMFLGERALAASVPLAAAEIAQAAPARLAAAASAEATSQVVFRLPNAVSVEDGHSLLAPIVDRALPIKRIALYQPGAHERHPLASMRIENDGDSSLPPGLITLYERDAAGEIGFVGDAQLDALPAGDTRLISFALDHKTTIERRFARTGRLSSMRAVDGVLETSGVEVETLSYTIAAPAREGRTVVIEQSIRPGWRVTSPRPASEGDGVYRFEVELEAGETAVLDVASERPSSQSLVLTDLDENRLLAMVEAVELPEDLERVIAEFAQLTRAVTQAEQHLERMRRARAEIVEDQERLRQNLRAAPRESDLVARYVEKLTSGEDRLETLSELIEEAQRKLDDAEQARADHLREIDF